MACNGAGSKFEKDSKNSISDSGSYTGILRGPTRLHNTKEIGDLFELSQFTPRI
jgi:hypothetical protein